jgi:hypothetical protein
VVIVADKCGRLFSSAAPDEKLIYHTAFVAAGGPVSRFRRSASSSAIWSVTCLLSW